MNQNFPKIWIIAIVLVIVIVGVLAWQYWLRPRQEVKAPEEGMPEEKEPEKTVDAWGVYEEYISITQEIISNRNPWDLSKLEAVSYRTGVQDYNAFMKNCPEEFEMSEAECEEMFWSMLESLKNLITKDGKLKKSDFKHTEENEKQVILSTDLKPDEDGGYSKIFLYFVKDEKGKVLLLMVSGRGFPGEGEELEAETKDSDKDGLTDKEESEIILSKEMCDRAGFDKWDMECVITDPNLKDTDGDGWWDGIEVEAETDPNNAADYPFL